MFAKPGVGMLVYVAMLALRKGQGKVEISETVAFMSNFVKNVVWEYVDIQKVKVSHVVPRFECRT